jgi:hypothetical protein
LTTTKKNNQNSYVKYSGIAIQMATIILIGTFGGKWIDSYLTFKFPIFTLILSILSVFFAVYYAIKDIIKFNK